MDDQKLLGRDRRNRSPDADQEYFIDKMRMLKTRLRKFEDENRVLYSCLAEQKSDVKKALRDKSFIINNLEFEMSEVRKQIHVLESVLSGSGDGDSGLTNAVIPGTSTDQIQSMLPSTSEHDRSLWMSRNKTLEENFKKELKKVKELERQIAQLSETLQATDRDLEELQEKNVFIEEENNIQREQITLLEDTVRDLEEAAQRAGVEVDEAATQTEVRGEQLMAIMNENVEEIICLVSKLAQLQQENAELESKYEESRRAFAVLNQDFHDRGKLMSELENELNGLKLRDRSSDRCERRRRRRSSSSVCDWESRVSGTVVNFDASVFLSPNSSRSCSSNSSAEFEEDDDGISLSEDITEAKKTEVRKFIRNLQNRRRTLHDAYRSST